MPIPTLGHRQFQILTGLIHGGEQTPQELRELIDWDVPKEGFFLSVRVLARIGLVGRYELLQRNGEGSLSKRPGLKITSAGRQVWQETFDWYLHQGERAQQTCNPGDVVVVVSRRKLPSQSEPRQPVRSATAEEERVILARLPADTHRTVCRLIREAGVRHGELERLTVSNFDLEQKRVTLTDASGIKRRRGISAELCESIAKEIGERVDGPAFFSRAGPFQEVTILQAFKSARRAAGLEECIKLRGGRRPPRNGRSTNRLHGSAGKPTGDGVR